MPGDVTLRLSASPGMVTLVTILPSP